MNLLELAKEFFVQINIELEIAEVIESEYIAIYNLENSVISFNSEWIKEASSYWLLDPVD